MAIESSWAWASVKASLVRQAELDAHESRQAFGDLMNDWYLRRAAYARTPGESTYQTLVLASQKLAVALEALYPVNGNGPLTRQDARQDA